MGKLINEFREMIKKDSSLGQESTWRPTYDTGLDVLDYRNAKLDRDGNIIKGIDSGKILMIIGRSGSGKSTVAMQIAASVVEPFDEGQIFHLDFERAGDSQGIRLSNLTGWEEDVVDEKYIHMDSNISTESVYKLIKSIAKTKIKNKDELQYDSGQVDRYGKSVMVYPPTVVLLDSLAVLAPEKMDEDEEMSGQMAL